MGSPGGVGGTQAEIINNTTMNKAASEKYLFLIGLIVSILNSFIEGLFSNQDEEVDIKVPNL
jgi:hypothetical protein